MNEPLDGITILDLTRVVAGGTATMMLADLGAEVIKVEQSGVGDILRHLGGHQRSGMNAMFLTLGRGKKSIALDLRNDEAQKIVRRLAATVDVVIENFRPGVMGKMGLGPSVLRADNPDLIFVSISGFGQTGPARDEPAYDPIIQARSAMIARQTAPGGQPDLVRSFLVDKLAGFYASQAILAALFARSTGQARGQTIDVPMMDSSLYFLWTDAISDLALVGDGITPGTVSSQAMVVTPTADGQVVFLALNAKERAGVATAVGRTDLLTDPRFATQEEYVKQENYGAFNDAITTAFSQTSTEAAVKALQKEGIPCSAVVSPEDVLDDVHVRGTDVVVNSVHPVAGPMRQIRYPAHLDETPARTALHAPELGADTAAILHRIGLDGDSIEELRRQKVVQ
ncbi:MAG: formyl-CoA transferase [Mycobacterium sp.]|nr:formyl-CoA transferase [Mycobacterium sp.]